jgi:lipopolysaccharide/colanic/teichoic acid biosynthesis glycosyltransferase
VVAVLALGSLVSYRASPFFVQKRLGRDGRLFYFVKIRSLPTSTPITANKYQLADVENHRWGRFLRHYHLDELPQLWLVVTARMSLVGPRPEMPSLSATFDQEFVRERLLVRPGCTGLWQISEGSAGLIGETPEYDLHYVRHWTHRLDAWVLMRSVAEIAGGRSLHAVYEIPDWTGASAEPELELVA